MKIFKKILLVLLVLVVVAAVIGWMLPAQVHVERNLVMKAPVENIYEQINVLDNWKGWSPWMKMDPEQEMTYNDIPSGTGASYSWNGKKTKTGTLTITEAKPYETIKTDLLFNGTDSAKAGFNFEKTAEGTNVVWYMDMNLGSNPFGRLMFNVFKGMMTDSFEQGLKDISALAEKMPAPGPGSSPIKTEERVLPATSYLFIHDTASVATVGEKMGRHFGTLEAAIKKQQLTVNGPAFAIYYTESTTNWEIDICMPVNKAGKAEGAIKAGTYAGGNAVVATVIGPYEGTGAGYIAAQEYIKKNEKKINGFPRERYISNPMTEKDSTKYITEICFPVQ